MTENIKTRSELVEGFISRVTAALVTPHAIERRAAAPQVWDVMDRWMERGERLSHDVGDAFDVLRCDDIGRPDELVMGAPMLSWEGEARALHRELSASSIGERFDAGRLLLRAMLEVLMKQMLKACSEYRDMIRRYRQSGELPTGVQEIKLSAETESAALQRWIKQQRRPILPPGSALSPTEQRPLHRPSPRPTTKPGGSCGSDVGTLLVAFGLGWWIGGGDE